MIKQELNDVKIGTESEWWQLDQFFANSKHKQN